MPFFPYDTISEFFEAEGDFEENTVDAFRGPDGQIDPDVPGVRWFINECGDVYPYPAHLQEEHFPNDFHLAYETEDQAEAASSALLEEDEHGYV